MEMYLEAEEGDNNRSDSKTSIEGLTPPTNNGVRCLEIINATAELLNCSRKNTSSPVTPLIIWTPDVIQRVVSIVFIMVVALIGNTIIIIVLSCSKYRKRNNRVNLFIINLAVGDLTVCFFTMSTEILFVAFGEWLLGAVACKIIPYVQSIALASTTFLLTAMGFDRYMAICRPLSFTNSKSRAKKIIAASWIMAFLFSIPQLVIFKQVETGRHPDGHTMYACKSKGYTAFWQRKLYFTINTVYILIIPAILISICYINVAYVVWQQGKIIAQSDKNVTPLRRSVSNKRPISNAKIKTIKMTFCIIVSFIACWTPYFVVTMIMIYSNYRFTISNSVIAFAETAALLQSALNPLWYGIFNIKLKRGLMEVFCPRKLTKRHSFHSWKNDFVTELMIVSEDCNFTNCKRKFHAQNNLSVARERSSSSSGASYEKTRSMIKEENVNGIRLRVRFTSPTTIRTFTDSRPVREAREYTTTM